MNCRKLANVVVDVYNMGYHVLATWYPIPLPRKYPQFSFGELFFTKSNDFILIGLLIERDMESQPR